jgi:hypothetical protein
MNIREHLEAKKKALFDAFNLSQENALAAFNSANAKLDTELRSGGDYLNRDVDSLEAWMEEKIAAVKALL